MGLFDKLKGKKESVDWSDAYSATPKFYGKPDGRSVTEWKLVLVSTSKDTIIGDTNYFVALKKVEQYSLDTNRNAILVKELSLAELESLKG